MKLVKNFLFAVLLVSVMAVTTPAGEQETPGAPTPPRATIGCDEKLYLCDSNTDETGDIAPETTDYLFYEALAALLSVY